MKKILFPALLSLVISLSVNAQNKVVILDSGVKAHREIDEIYGQFNVGYQKLDVNLVANLYAENANYLASGNTILDGRVKIRENFAGFFDDVRKKGNTMEIAFHILQREVDKNLGYDVGIYTLKTFKNGTEIGSGKGKFIVITKKIGKKWVFQYDSYSNLLPEKKN